VGNLESPLTSASRPAGAIGAFLRAAPETVKVLALCGFNAVTVANNHSIDYGCEGLIESLRVLDEHGIRHCGGGDSPVAARAPAVLTAKGVRVGMLGYCDDYRPAGEGRLAPAAVYDDRVILADIKALRPKVDLLVLQLHWGYEFALYPLLTHRERARSFAAAGADLVLCHHAHVPMGLEITGKSLIAYGLGNFIFPLFQYQRMGHPWTDRSFALKANFSKSGLVSAELVPVGIAEDHYAHVLENGTRNEMLGALGLLSRRLLDDRKLARIEHDRMIREACHYLEVFRTYRPEELDEARERAMFLRAPRQQQMLQHLLHAKRLADGADGQPSADESRRRAGELLTKIAEAADTSDLLPMLATQLGGASCAQLLHHLRSSLSEDLPGRIP
jgi:poly-gamma-glutamate synthesis protein (capsule biosynthesis protein)